MPVLPEGRTLTDADVEAITEAMSKRIVKAFYMDLGKGVWSFVWKLFVSSLIGLAAYGAGKGMLTK